MLSIHRIVRGASALIVAAMVACVGPLAASATPAQATPPPAKEGNVSTRLDQLADAAGVATSSTAENQAAGLPASGAGSLLHQADGTFLANARLTDVDAATEAALARAGARVTARSVADHLVTLALDPTDIANVAAVAGVEWLEEVLEPTVHRGEHDGLAAALQEGGVETNALCSARVISEADTHLGAANARSAYGVNGAGIKVGVLSDSYNNLGGAATDVTNGELPGPGNPCGFTTAVTLQSELASGGSDEGRAMAQAVHDLAPGAQILVASAFNGDVDFANQIRALANNGAKVIVDDISYFNEPMYQDGIIAKAVADVTAQGVTYFSSAANSNVIIGGRDVASYETLQYRPTTCPGTISSTYGVANCHDWDPGAGADAGNLLNVNNGGRIQIKLGWNEPQYNVDSDLDMFLVDNSNNTVVAAAVVGNPFGSKQAYELLTYTNSSGVAKTYRVVIGRYQSNTITRFKTILLDDTGLTSVQWNQTSGSDVVGPTGYGHNMMRGAGSVAAIRYNSTTAPETFSSRGPATYCFGPVVGTTPASPLTFCETATVGMTATDGAANSFFGSLSGSVYRFYGTSQAAPHAAAVAALQLAVQPCRTPAEVLAAQRTTGTAIGSYGVDAVGGGRINASAAIAALASCIPLPTAPTNVNGTPGNGQVTFTWTAPSSPGGSPIVGYRITPYINGLEQTTQTFNSTATTQTATGLTNGTAYTFRIAAFSSAGTGAASAETALITPRTIPGVPTGVQGTGGNGQANLVWSAPVSEGGSPITSYTVIPYIGSTAQTPRVFNSSEPAATVTGLTNGTTYTFKVKATNAAGSSAESAASAAITPSGTATAPTNVTGVAGISQVTLSWTAPTSTGGGAITGYTITPYINGSPLSPETFAGTATTQTITGLSNGTAYTFTVMTETANGPGIESAPSAPVTPRNVPSFPTNVTGTPGDSQVTLVWDAPIATGGSPITGYTVTPYITGVAQTPRVFASAATTQVITGLTNGTTYTFKVRATNAAGSSDDSMGSAGITPSGPPTAPTDVTGVPGDGQVTLSWTAPSSDGGSPLVGYIVTPFIGTTAQTQSVFFSTDTTQVIGGLTNGTAYTFKVKASNAAGSSVDSAASAAITPRAVPGAPTGVTGTPGDQQVTLSWTAPASNGGSPITGYTVIPYVGSTAQTPILFGSTATTQVVSGLTNGTAYTFTVRAMNAVGGSAQSVPSAAITPRTLPGAPTGVTGTPGDQQVALSWTAPASNGGLPITGYRVTPYIGANAQTPIPFASTATSQVISGLTNGTAYTFKVAATTAAGTGADSASSSAITPRALPSAPTGLSATPGNAQAQLTWTAPSSDGGSPITGYTVTPYVGANAQTPRVFSSTATTQTVTGLTNGTTYTFKVAATTAAGTGADSAASAPVIPRTQPTAPTGVSGTPGNQQVTLSWTTPSSDGGLPITGYRITPSIGGNAQTPIDFASTATSQTVTGLTNGTAYTFKVAALTSGGVGTESTATAAITPRTLAGAPTGLSATAGNAQATLTWTAPASDGGLPITGYRVTPFIGANAQAPVTFNSTATTQSVTGLTNGTAYTFKVAAITGAGTGPDSAASDAVTPRTQPTAPTNVSGTPGNQQVTLSWTTPSSDGGLPITGYRITPSIGGVAQTPIDFASTATTQTITGLINGTAYTFKVAALTSGGVGTESTATAAITPRTLPGAPTGLTATAGNASAMLTWTAPASDGGLPITGYRVTPFIGANAQTPVTFNSTATTQNVSGLTNGTTYTFKVAAITGAGTGPDSAASDAVLPRTQPTAPTNVSGTPGNQQVTLSWTTPSSDGGLPITGYRVIPSIAGVAQTPVDFASTATTQTVTGLANGTAYTFKVAALTSGGVGTESTATAAITPRTVPGAPTGLVGTIGNAQVVLSWNAPASNGGLPLTGYTVTPYIGANAQSPRVFASTATTQTITGLTNGTAYTFTVKATSAAGTGAASTPTAALTPRTLPSAPTNVTGTPGNAQVSLSWTAPTSDGGLPITGYRVTPSIGGVAQTPVDFSSTATSQTLAGLTNGTAYTFKVAATTSAGTGADSTASAAITPRTVPGAPTGVSGTSGNAQVTLTWTAPASNGGSAITGYTVTPAIAGTPQTPVVFTSAATSQAITGLTNGTAYTFTVKATNAAGTGVDSAASAAVTPALPTSPFAPFASWGAMVDRFYLDMLGRAPTASERSSRITQLTNGTITPGGLIANLRLDTDNVNNVDPVTRLYRAYFLRIPDRGGLTYWIRQRRVNGKKLNAISDSFASSNEFKTKYGSLSNRAFVNLIYQNVLGRAGEASGVNYWTSRLDRKVSTRGQVMTGFSESNEYKTKQTAEVHVSVIYILLLGRAPTATEFNAAVAGLDAGTLTPAQIAQAIIESPAYATRITS